MYFAYQPDKSVEAREAVVGLGVQAVYQFLTEQEHAYGQLVLFVGHEIGT